MTNIVTQFEQRQIAAMTQNKVIPSFRAGDTVRVSVKVMDGATARVQAYEGVVIGMRSRGITSSFVVRKISHGEGVERRFMTYSPIIDKIEVKKYGIVRRAKLNYLRGLSGKKARIRERRVYQS